MLGQAQGRVFKIGFLRPGPPPKAWTDAFHKGLRDLGYVEGRNVVVEYRYSDGSGDALTRLAEELVRLNVDVILASSAPAQAAAQKATTTVPIVFVGVPDPVGIGLAPNLPRPGANVTGVVAISTADLAGKRLELLREAAPKVPRVAVLWHPENPSNPMQLKGAQATAATMNVQLQALPVSGPGDFESAFERARGGGLLLLDAALFTTHRKSLVDLASKSRVVTMYGFREFVEVGGLMSYGPSFPDLYRRAATYVDKILKGAKAGDLPIEQPLVFELVINLKTAKAQKVTISKELLLRADQVIQ